MVPATDDNKEKKPEDDVPQISLGQMVSELEKKHVWIDNLIAMNKFLFSPVQVQHIKGQMDDPTGFPIGNCHRTNYTCQYVDFRAAD